MMDNPVSGYPTYRNFIYLGIVSKNVRRRAKNAGLVSLTAKDFRRLIERSFAGSRMLYEGTWYDTVKYP